MSSTPPPRPGHPYYMHDAIYSQPGALRLVTRGNDAALAGASARLRAMDHVVLAGSGASWHVALAGELLVAHRGRLGHRVRALHSFELTGYWPELDARTGVVVVSHRGSDRYGRAGLERAKASAGVAVTVTGKGHQNLAAADYTLRTVDQERSAAHTVSYTSALALLAALAARIGADDELARALDEIPDQLAGLLGQESWEELAARFADRRRYYVIGGGPNRATAYEAALKMNEAAHATAIGLGCEQFLHGPWAALEAGDALVAVAPPGPSYDRCVAAARAAREVGASVIAIAQEGDRDLARVADETIAIPPVSEWLSPILAIVPLQLLAYHLAVGRAVNPDTMRIDEPAYGRAFDALSS
jgi:glucosamine--fructose-6-phosphate aminotransferase (isomerizing)